MRKDVLCGDFQLNYGDLRLDYQVLAPKSSFQASTRKNTKVAIKFKKITILPLQVLMTSLLHTSCMERLVLEHVKAVQ
ncbi:hypothetical protein L2E82_21008 [Cichorium intybus]|uniref:Uncharacterized protein n=1 Tax=Cichorium intybus TaxID=13427 RepID=A0ACB9DUL5_CICIN|nr:hypothetical protein L2E82_21008 [Cichorium intybus]